jgi:hypothetical protein
MTNITRRQVVATADAYANGSILETLTLTITSDGATSIGTVDPVSGTILTHKFSNGLIKVDYSTPKTITLSDGTATVPQENFLYVLKTDPTTLVVGTSDFPAAEYAPIARVSVLTPALVQAGTGVIKQHNYTDHTEDANGQGHITHINNRLREEFPTWKSGVTPTITGSGTGTVTYATTSGIVQQLHDHTFPAMADPADLYIINDSVTPYRITTNLGGGILADATGASLTGKYYILVSLAIISETGSGHSKILINLPFGSYNTLNQALQDADKTINKSVPADNRGVSFLIQKVVMRNQADTTFTVEDSNLLLGETPSTIGGTALAQATEFPDSTFRVFNNADNTKVIALDGSFITTGTTRTAVMPDKDGILAMLDDIPTKQPFSIVATAGQTDFPLPSTPTTPASVTAFRNGVEAANGVNFSVAGSTLTWITPTLLVDERISGFYNDVASSNLITVLTKSASDIAALGDAAHIIEYTNGASDFTYTLPQNSDVAFQIGSWIELRKTGTGEITIAKGTGATFRSALGDVSVKIDGANGFSVFVEKTAVNTWLLSGAVKAV